jgi:flagellar basal-body rod protein FlgG
MRSLSIGATGMLAQQTNVEVISNNIANMSTTAYKRQRAEFQDLLYQNVVRPGSTSSEVGTIVPSGIQLGAGVKTSAVYRINEQGNLTITDNQLDLAISGLGYFQIELPNGETAYTRAGAFQLNAEGTIVTAEGYPVQPQMQVPGGASSITVNESGQVYVKVPGEEESQLVGQLELASFPNPGGLEAIGDNLMLQTPASGDPVPGNPGSDAFGKITQGALETSNVNIVAEITNLITAQRSYEMNSKVIRASDEMMNTVNQLR